MIVKRQSFCKMGARAFTGTGSPKQLRKNEKRKQIIKEWQTHILRHLDQRYRLLEQERKNRRFQ